MLVVLLIWWWWWWRRWCFFGGKGDVNSGQGSWQNCDLQLARSVQHKQLLAKKAEFLTEFPLPESSAQPTTSAATGPPRVSGQCDFSIETW
jgi:hypothetical protein